MKLSCVHGYFFFEEEKEGEMSTFMGATGYDIVQKDNFFTFAELEDAPEFSILGVAYLGAIATATYAGRPWEVMRANGFVYDFVNELVKPISSVTSAAIFDAAPSYFYSDSLILPGARMLDGSQVTGFSGFARADATKFRYTEVRYD